jgi:hypothetical protein
MPPSLEVIYPPLVWLHYCLIVGTLSSMGGRAVEIASWSASDARPGREGTSSALQR